MNLEQFAINVIAQVFLTSPEALANYSSFQNLLSNNLPPYGEVGVTFLDPTNPLLTQFSNPDVNTLLPPSDQPSIFNI